MGGPIFAGAWLENGDAFDSWGEATLRTNASAGVILDTLVGPVILAAPPASTAAGAPTSASGESSARGVTDAEHDIDGETDAYAVLDCRSDYCGCRHGMLGSEGGRARCAGDRSSIVARGRAGIRRPGGGLARQRCAAAGGDLADGRASGGGPPPGGEAVHGRLRRDGQASRDSRRRDLQPHALLRRQGTGTRADLRVGQVVRRPI